MSDLGWNVWSVVSGVLGIVLTPIASFVIWMHTRLPSKKLPALIAIFEETEALFDQARREGILTDQEVEAIKLSVNIASMHVYKFCATVYSTSSYIRNVKNWRRGVTDRILKLHDELNVIRVQLMERQSKERGMRIFGDPPANIDNREDNIQTPSDVSMTDSVMVSIFATGVSKCTPPATMPPQPSDSQAATHFMVSKNDLKSLVSLAITHPLLREGKGTYQHRIYREVAHHLGMPMSTVNHTPSLLHSRCQGPNPYAKHRTGTLQRKLSRIMQRIYGVRDPGEGWDTEGDFYVDSESLSSPCAGHDDDGIQRA
ncbi:hypothetical protein BC628DRAFT_1423985 [Trametes gibbosa]|nr:hypothetical protein BC628DRAFT_1423985 [Trametes gibbosa]